jgi:hypothetical protein
MSLGCEIRKSGFNTTNAVELAQRPLRRGLIALTGEMTTTALPTLEGGEGLINGLARLAEGPRPASRQLGMGKVSKEGGSHETARLVRGWTCQ